MRREIPLYTLRGVSGAQVSTHYITTWYVLIATLQGHLRQASRLYFLGADRRWEQDLVRSATEGALGR
jgi:hypothetical protein